MSKTQTALSLLIASAAIMVTSTLTGMTDHDANISASIVNETSDSKTYESLLNLRGTDVPNPNTLTFNNGNQYREVTNERDLLEKYEKLIDIDLQDDNISDEDLESLLFLASRYELNPELQKQSFQVLPVHSRTTTTDGNWGALLNPLFPSSHMRQEKPGYFLTANEVANDLAKIFSKSDKKASEALYALGAIRKDEISKWESQERVGVPLLESAGLMRKVMKLSEEKGLEEQAKNAAQNQFTLEQEALTISKNTISFLALSFLEERKTSAGGPNEITPRVIAEMSQHLGEKMGQTITAQDVLDLKAIFMGERLNSPYQLAETVDLGDCNNQLSSKMTLNPHMITGVFGSQLTCELRINDTEQVEITIRVPAYSSLINFVGLPLMNKYSNSSNPRRPGFELLFPMNLNNSVIIGPEGEEELEIEFKMKKRKTADKHFGLGVIKSDGSVQFAETKAYTAGRKVTFSFRPRSLEGNKALIYIEEALTNSQQ